jgi:hypothetical protein
MLVGRVRRQVPVMSMVLKAGGQAEFDQVMKIWEEAPSNVEKKQVGVGRGAPSSRHDLESCV